jgi:hypothetical protein
VLEDHLAHAVCTALSNVDSYPPHWQHVLSVSQMMAQLMNGRFLNSMPMQPCAMPSALDILVAKEQALHLYKHLVMVAARLCGTSECRSLLQFAHHMKVSVPRTCPALWTCPYAFCSDFHHCMSGCVPFSYRRCQGMPDQILTYVWALPLCCIGVYQGSKALD